MGGGDEKGVDYLDEVVCEGDVLIGGFEESGVGVEVGGDDGCVVVLVGKEDVLVCGDVCVVGGGEEGGEEVGWFGFERGDVD